MGGILGISKQSLPVFVLANWTIGCDSSGTVEEVGPDCETEVKKGDRVFGASHGANWVG